MSPVHTRIEGDKLLTVHIKVLGPKTVIGGGTEFQNGRHLPAWSGPSRAST